MMLQLFAGVSTHCNHCSASTRLPWWLHLDSTGRIRNLFITSVGMMWSLIVRLEKLQGNWRGELLLLKITFDALLCSRAAPEQMGHSEY